MLVDIQAAPPIEDLDHDTMFAQFAELPTHVLDDLVADSAPDIRLYPLVSQLRVNAGSDCASYVRQIL